ncbi:unnamed protein product [Rhizophagus irregularis]|nr:unnamed protein product [Rhizophagus irregularis]
MSQRNSNSSRSRDSQRSQSQDSLRSQRSQSQDSRRSHMRDSHYSHSHHSHTQDSCQYRSRSRGQSQRRNSQRYRSRSRSQYYRSHSSSPSIRGRPLTRGDESNLNRTSRHFRSPSVMRRNLGQQEQQPQQPGIQEFLNALSQQLQSTFPTFPTLLSNIQSSGIPNRSSEDVSSLVLRKKSDLIRFDLNLICQIQIRSDKFNLQFRFRSKKI